MSSVLPFVINLVNTAFGVTVLAVPYCFHQCGLILGSLVLFASSYATKKSCSFLLRASQISRKHDFESLGFHVGGDLGKLIVEMSLIGYLLGTAIAWFVVIGDVAPPVVSSILGLNNTWDLRTVLIVLIGVCIVLPLSLVKDITSLSNASNIAIAMYIIFALQLFLDTLPQILAGDWLTGLNFWKPEGVLQCLPIFGISFLCQTVLFVLYDALPEPSVKKMEHVVNRAMDIVLFLSFLVGFSGYVRYFNKGVEGDLLKNYKHDFVSELIRLGFCVSTVLSFPLLVFPCRSSINSMISAGKNDVISVGGTFISEDRFMIITCSIIIGALTCGVLFPSVEFVMALVGATMGAMLTYILPSYIFLKVAGDDGSKFEAKVLLVVGVCLLCLSTFSVLNVKESQIKEEEIVSMLNQDRSMIKPLETNLNFTLVKSFERSENILDLNKRKNYSDEKILGRGKLTDNSEEDAPKKSAEVVGEARKEPVLPQEGGLPQNKAASNHLQEKRQPLIHNDQPDNAEQPFDDLKIAGRNLPAENELPVIKEQPAESHLRDKRDLSTKIQEQPVDKLSAHNKTLDPEEQHENDPPPVQPAKPEEKASQNIDAIAKPDLTVEPDVVDKKANNI